MSALADKLFMNGFGVCQQRVLGNEDPQAAIGAYATATLTRGAEFEIKWVPVRNSLLFALRLAQETEFTPNAGGALLVDARTPRIRGRARRAGQCHLSGGGLHVWRAHAHRVAADMPEFASKQAITNTTRAVDSISDDNGLASH